MASKSIIPKLTLAKLNKRFPDELSCKHDTAKLRWNDKPVYPYCGYTKS